jgi:WS/DGAT/MGAT family acyltransferase
MWFATGLEGDRVAVLIVVHHALADGMTAMRMLRSLLDGPTMTEATASALREARRPASRPGWGELARDNVRTTLASVLWLARPATWRRAAAMIRAAQQVDAIARHAPRTSLNAPVGPQRRLATLRLDHPAVKRVARAHGCSANDVILGLITGGVHDLLEARGEPVERLRPRAGIAVALFSSGRGREAGNDIGTLHVRLPLAERNPGARLQVIAAGRARAMRSPLVAAEPMLRASLGRVRWFRRSLEHQRLVNLAETYLPGPPMPIDVLGAPVLDLLPIAPLAGNLGLSFVALSYARRLTVAVRVDADRFPDLDLLLAGMERDARALGVA